MPRKSPMLGISLSAVLVVAAVALAATLLPEADGAVAVGAATAGGAAADRAVLAAAPATVLSASAVVTPGPTTTTTPEPDATSTPEPRARPIDLPLLADAASYIGDRLAGLMAVAEQAAGQDSAAGVVETDAATPKASDKTRQRKKKQKPSTKRRLTLVKSISGGGLSPKSIVADQNGQVFAMNMMYNHNVTVFNRHYKRKKVIDDTINLAKHGFRQYTAKVRGAPVEAAVSPDGSRIYVSNYTMYGPGFRNQGFDLCTPRDKIDRGFVYVINTKSLRKIDAIQVGEVPKYLAVTPDGRYLLVGNWCSWDISVVDLRKNREIRRIDAGVAPRGIAFSPNSKTAYVTLVGEDRILVIDMKSYKVKRDITGIGVRPRHLVMGPGGRYLYITSQGKEKPKFRDGQILKYDTRKRRVVERSVRLHEPRTTVLSDDGKSLYVVDYHPGTIVKLNARNLNVIQKQYLGYHPIGVTYVNESDKLWVAGYGGNVWVLKDK